MSGKVPGVFPPPPPEATVGLFFPDPLPEDAPLAARMRPQTLDEFVGQEDIVGPGTLLRRAIETDELPSLILYGPPGTGKTSLARIIARLTHSRFEQINAVTAGGADLKRIIAEALDRRAYYQTRTILFIDEIHRFNKAQQDVLLPAVEDGTIILIGATTENPFFEVNATLVSRSRVLQLEPLREEDLRTILQRALTGPRARWSQAVTAYSHALRHLVTIANAGGRIALNGL